MRLKRWPHLHMLKVSFWKSIFSLCDLNMQRTRTIWTIIKEGDKRIIPVKLSFEAIVDDFFFVFVCFCCFTSQVNSYGHGLTVSSSNHTFSWASLNKHKCRSRWGQGVWTPPPGKSQVIWVSIGNKQLDPPWKSWTPMENVGPLWNLEKW